MHNCRSVLPDSLVDAIYEGADTGASWQNALTILRDLIPSDWVTLRLILEPEGCRKYSTLREVCFGLCSKTPELLESFITEVPAEFLPANLPLNKAVVTLWNPAELNGSALKYCQTYDMGMSLSVCVAAYGKAKYILQFTRTTARSNQSGPYCEQDRILTEIAGKHFSRALELRRKLGLATTTSDYQAGALDNLGVAGFLVTPDHSVHNLNELANSMVVEEDGLKKINGRLVAVDKSDDVKFQRMLDEALALKQPEEAEFGLTFAREDCRHGLGVTIKPRPYRSLMSSIPETCALVFVRKPEWLSMADAKLIQQMFDFTPAEAKIAIRLACGQALEDIERSINIRHNTARAHLRSIYQKAEVNNMAQLIHLLSSRTMPIGHFDSHIFSDLSSWKGTTGGQGSQH